MKQRYRHAAVVLKTNRSIIRATSLHLLPGLHASSIYQIFFLGSYWFTTRENLSWVRLRAYMLSALLLSRRSYPAVSRAGQLAHQRSSHLGPLVLEMTPLNSPTPTTDRDRTVSRRSEPSSRAAFMGEQPNPWDLLQPQDATSRHRGAKPCRRCELLGKISLLSPG